MLRPLHQTFDYLHQITGDLPFSPRSMAIPFQAVSLHARHSTERSASSVASSESLIMQAPVVVEQAQLEHFVPGGKSIIYNTRQS